MKYLLLAVLLTIAIVPSICFAKGGFSSGGGRGGFSSFSGGSRSYGSSSRSYSSPSRSYSSSYSSPSRSTTTTTVTRSYGGRGYGGGYYGAGMMYPGFGMGYGYSNGMLTGLIIGNMMHPQGTTVYSGGGYSGGNALLYPDGRVVNQDGYQVGTYTGGQFTAVQGGMVAQPAPPMDPVPVNVATPMTFWDVVGCVVAVGIVFFLAIMIIAVFLG